MRNRNYLLVSPRAPWPSSNGGQQRTFLLAEAIRRIGNLHTILVNPKPGPTSSDIDVMKERFGLVDDGIIFTKRAPIWQKRLFPDHHQFKTSDSLSARISEIARRLSCNAAIFRYLPIAARSSPAATDGLRRYVDVDDVPSLRAVTEYEFESGLKRIGKMWIANRISVGQRRALSRVDGGWVSCQEDLDIIRDNRFTVLPNIPFDARFGPSETRMCSQATDSRSVLFVGAMDYAINEQAMSWFLANVWPKVTEYQPDAIFRLVGGGISPEAKRQFAGYPNVQMVGYVDDLESEYRNCALSVVPINAGAGTKIKVLESLRFGRPVVLTQHSLRGYGDLLKDGLGVMIANEPGKMALAIADLIKAPKTRELMALSGQEIVNKKFGFDQFANVIANRLEQPR